MIPTRLTATQAAKVLGMAPITLKQYIRAGIWGFGEVIPGRKIGQKNDRVIIWTGKLESHIGRKITEEEINDG